MFTQPTLYIGMMNGHHKISISGVVFYVEGECRNLLMNHINWIHSHTARPVTDRYDTDEERLAELLLDELKEEGKEVVTSHEVQKVINRTKYLR